MKKSIALAAIALFLAGSAAAQIIEMNVADRSFRIELNGNDAAVAFTEQMPLKLVFENYGSVERVAYLPKPLKLGNAPRSSEPTKGDISYYPKRQLMLTR